MGLLGLPLDGTNKVVFIRLIYGVKKTIVFAELWSFFWLLFEGKKAIKTKQYLKT